MGQIFEQRSLIPERTYDPSVDSQKIYDDTIVAYEFAVPNAFDIARKSSSDPEFAASNRA